MALGSLCFSLPGRQSPEAGAVGVGKEGGLGRSVHLTSVSLSACPHLNPTTGLPGDSWPRCFLIQFLRKWIFSFPWRCQLLLHWNNNKKQSDFKEINHSFSIRSSGSAISDRLRGAACAACCWVYGRLLGGQLVLTVGRVARQGAPSASSPSGSRLGLPEVNGCRGGWSPELRVGTTSFLPHSISHSRSPGQPRLGK